MYRSPRPLPHPPAASPPTSNTQTDPITFTNTKPKILLLKSSDTPTPLASTIFNPRSHLPPPTQRTSEQLSEPPPMAAFKLSASLQGHEDDVRSPLRALPGDEAPYRSFRVLTSASSGQSCHLHPRRQRDHRLPRCHRPAMETHRAHDLRSSHQLYRLRFHQLRCLHPADPRIPQRFAPKLRSPAATPI